jgi:ribose transport system permease protein
MEKTLQKKSIFNADTLQKVLAFAALIVLVLFFSWRSEFFFTAKNLVNIGRATSAIGVMALGVTFVIITAGIDLSVGTNMTFSAVIAGVVITMWGLPIWLGIIAGILAGATCGLINGLVITRLKVPPFIATLGMLMMTKGLSLVISDTKPIYFNETPVYGAISKGSIFGSVIPGLDIPNAVLIFALAAIVAGIILSKTVLGRYTFAIGSNEEATRLSGINVKNWLVAIYALCGAFCGLSGVLFSARLDSAQPALGQGYELDAIAAAVIGGTSLSGGEGTIVGTVIGAFIMSVLNNGLRVLSVPQEWQYFIIGAVVIGAVYLDVLRHRKENVQ